MELVGWIGAGIVIVVAAGIAGIWIYLKKKYNKPTYVISQGVKVYCQECSHMKKRKADVEEELNRCIDIFGNSKFFEKGRVIEEARRLSIYFKKKPFKKTSGEKVNGMCDSGSRFIAVYIPEFSDLQQTGIDHELCHYYMEVILKRYDCSHSMREFWGLIGE